MTVRVAINGFGRIGRLVCRIICEQRLEDIHLLAINDLAGADQLAYLFKYDSTHGPFQGEVRVDQEMIVIDEKNIRVYAEKDPGKLPWKELGVDYVIESTGLFTKVEEARKHLLSGARRVIISAPAKGDVPTFVMGVNEKNYRPDTDNVVSNASCTTNCLALIVKVLLDHFGIEEGLMTTIHAVTASQPTVDGYSKKDWRGGRGALQNIIPSTTGATKAVALCLPEIKGKLTGMAFRVPVGDVSTVDLTVRLSRSTTYEEICQAMKSASLGPMKGLLAYCDQPLVSSDFISNPNSAIFDEKAGLALNSHFYKIIAWYDNEWGYAARIVDLLRYMAEQET